MYISLPGDYSLRMSCGFLKKWLTLSFRIFSPVRVLDVVVSISWVDPTFSRLSPPPAAPSFLCCAVCFLPLLRSTVAKVIYVCRNPKDVCVSLQHHASDKPFFDYKGEFSDMLKFFAEGRFGLSSLVKQQSYTRPNLAA